MNIARMIYDAYPDADLLAIDPDEHCTDLPTFLNYLETHDVGDTLLLFIVREAKDMGGDPEQVVRALNRASEELTAVLNGIESQME